MSLEEKFNVQCQLYPGEQQNTKALVQIAKEHYLEIFDKTLKECEEALSNDPGLVNSMNKLKVIRRALKGIK